MHSKHCTLSDTHLCLPQEGVVEQYENRFIRVDQGAISRSSKGDTHALPPA